MAHNSPTMTLNASCANGLKVTLIETDARTVGITLIGNAGALYGTPGLAHFLEHTALCATRRHPDFISLAQTVDSLGAHRNASTSQEDMRFIFKCLPEHLPQALEFLAEVAVEPLLLPRDVEKQKGIIGQEIRLRDNDAQSVARFTALAGLYQASGPGVRVLGSEDSTGRISRDALAELHARAFKAGNFRLVICGRLDQPSVMRIAEATLGRMPAGDALPMPAQVQASESPTHAVIRRQGITQAAISMAWSAPSSADPARHAVNMFRLIMSEGRMSRLWQALRQRSALTYSTSCSYVRQRSFGHLSITTGLAAENVDRALGEIRSEIALMAREHVSDEDLERARNLVRTSLAFESDSPIDCANYHATRLLFEGDFTGIEDELARYQAVTKEDIRAAAESFARQAEHIAVVTPQ